MRNFKSVLCLPLAALMAGLLSTVGGCAQQAAPMQADGVSWQEVLDERLPLYGHRNWIVIADSAYPAQTRDGIETVATNADQIKVVSAVLKALDHSVHVKPIIYTDAELKYVPEADAPGINAYRAELAGVLGDRPVQVIPHEQVIAKLDAAGQTFKVLILKTKMAVPYTSVFLQLDCRYWNAAAEQRLRAALAAPGSAN